MHRQSLVDYGKPLQATEAADAQAAGHRGAAARLPLRRVPLRHPPAGRLFRSGRRPEARRARQPARCPSRWATRSPARWRRRAPTPKASTQGKRYAAYPWIGCGKCGLCARGDEHMCNAPRALGITVDGGYATHVLVPHPRYLLDVEGIAPEIAGAADVLRPHRLRRHQEGAALPARRPAADRRPRRRRHDGPAVRPRPDRQADLRRRHRRRPSARQR